MRRLLRKRRLRFRLMRSRSRAPKGLDRRGGGGGGGAGQRKGNPKSGASGQAYAPSTPFTLTRAVESREPDTSAFATDLTGDKAVTINLAIAPKNAAAAAVADTDPAVLVAACVCARSDALACAEPDARPQLIAGADAIALSEAVAGEVARPTKLRCPTTFAQALAVAVSFTVAANWRTSTQNQQYRQTRYEGRIRPPVRASGLAVGRCHRCDERVGRLDRPAARSAQASGSGRQPCTSDSAVAISADVSCAPIFAS